MEVTQEIFKIVVGKKGWFNTPCRSDALFEKEGRSSKVGTAIREDLRFTIRMVKMPKIEVKIQILYLFSWRSSRICTRWPTLQYQWRK